MYVVLARSPLGPTAQRFDDSGGAIDEPTVVELDLFVAATEREKPRWVWDDTRRWYPQLLAEGLRVERCVDLRLCHAILRNTALSATSRLATADRNAWDSMPTELVEPRAKEVALFDFDVEPEEEPDPAEEWLLQRDAAAASANPGKLALLLSIESAGALIACEMKFAGLPVNAALHDRLLTELLGPRPLHGERPAKLEALLDRMKVALDSTDVNPDSPNELLKALGRAGLQATSTRSWELKEIEHPVIEPLLEYKKLSRLMTANGWSWLETWVAEGRFRPEYLPGGVVTGRWASTGGGALQLPKQIRGAVVADPGWKLVVADASQLEPRILTALSGDRRMAAAGRGDLYEGIVASGAVKTRAEAKVAMLGAMYGATTGESGRLLPGLARAFPQALALVEDAARAGERGEIVSTLLGRSSPLPGSNWVTIQGEASEDAQSDRRARSQARSWGRFTRNFVVQGTAAEWALCWMAGVRQKLWSMTDGTVTERPHLVFFLHDEIMVHTPVHLANEVVALIHEAAAEAGRLLFGPMPVQFPVTAVAVDVYADAK